MKVHARRVICTKTVENSHTLLNPRIIKLFRPLYMQQSTSRNLASVSLFDANDDVRLCLRLVHLYTIRLLGGVQRSVQRSASSSTPHYCRVVTYSVFQISWAYSSMQRSELKNPIRATAVIDLVSHVSWSLYSLSIIACVSM